MPRKASQKPPDPVILAVPDLPAERVDEVVDARPQTVRVRDPKVQGLIVGMMRGGVILEEVAKYVGVSPRAISKAAERDPRFRAEIDDARSIADTGPVLSLYKQAMAGNVTACIFWLKNRLREDWRDAHEIETPGLEALVMAATEVVRRKRKAKGGE